MTTELETLRKSRSAAAHTDPASLPLLDFVPAVSPGAVRPNHLAPLANAFERAARGEVVRALFSFPPQHGKSLLVHHAIVQRLLRGDAIPILYLTYSIDFSFRQARKMRRIAESAGLKFRPDSRSYTDWELESGGSLLATGVGGPVTGNPGKLIVLDDLIQNWKAALSRAVRDAAFFCVDADILTRAHPDTSVIGINTRWNDDDVVGRLEKIGGWEVYNFPAIQDDGTALWPEQRPIEWLEKERATRTRHVFEALYQGRPRPLGGTVFEGVHYADEPPQGYQAAIGVDLAYSEKTHADHSISLVLVKDGNDAFQVRDVVRKQVRATEFLFALKAHQTAYPGSRMRWYAAGTEKGIADFMAAHGVNVGATPPNGGKLVRAQAVAAAWNAGKIRVPHDAPWLEAFVSEVLSFTGTGDAHDDQVDALAAAYDQLVSGSGTVNYESVAQRPTSGLKRYM